MSDNIKSLKCPNCNAPIKLDNNTCEFCGYDYIIQSLAKLTKIEPTKISKYIAFYKNQLDANPNDSMTSLALGICYLELGLADFAQSYIKKAIDISPDNSDTYYYYALSLLEGKNIKLMNIPAIKEVEKFLEAAIKINPEKITYYHFQVIIKQEFYLKNGFRANPPIDNILSKTISLTIDEKELEQLAKRLNLNIESIKSLILR